MINSQNILYIPRIKTKIKTKKCNRIRISMDDKNVNLHTF